jgi:hypothetical protein
LPRPTRRVVWYSTQVQSKGWLKFGHQEKKYMLARSSGGASLK